jgi:phosphoacetylglucosamine mutase
VQSVKGVIAVDFGVQTTPILHYLVKCENDSSYGAPTVDAYYLMLADGFSKFVGNGVKAETVWIDCANGVGAIAAKLLGEALKGLIEFKLVNADIGDASVLNENVWNVYG